MLTGEQALLFFLGSILFFLIIRKIFKGKIKDEKTIEKEYQDLLTLDKYKVKGQYDH